MGLHFGMLTFNWNDFIMKNIKYLKFTVDMIDAVVVIYVRIWGCSSVGRASGWQSEGQGFKPPQLH